MAQKSKAAALTPDLLTSNKVSRPVAPRKQATDLSLVAQRNVSIPKQTQSPPKVDTKPKAGNKPGIDTRNGDLARAATVPGSLLVSGTAPVAESAPSPSHGKDGTAMVVEEDSKAAGQPDYRIQIPVPLQPSEHLELTLAAARSGRSCQEIMVEALVRYLDDIAGAPGGPAAPGSLGK